MLPLIMDFVGEPLKNDMTHTVTIRARLLDS